MIDDVKMLMMLSVVTSYDAICPKYLLTLSDIYTA